MAKSADRRVPGVLQPPGISVGWVGNRLTRDVIATHGETRIEVHARFPAANYTRRQMTEMVAKAGTIAVKILQGALARLSRSPGTNPQDVSALIPEGFEIELVYPNRPSIPDHLRSRRLRYVGHA